MLIFSKIFTLISTDLPKLLTVSSKSLVPKISNLVKKLIKISDYETPSLIKWTTLVSE
jgi:hypothetical protein